MATPKIEGQLPFNTLASAGQAFQGLGGSPQQAAAALGPAYNSAYSSALAFNTANYGNILKGYQDTLAGQQDALSSIGRGYSDLSSQVMGTLEGAGRAERQRIADAYASEAGRASQSLVNRGLGNSTVVDSTQRGLFADQQKQYVDLANQLAQQRAGYQSQLGLAGLSQQQQATLANSALGQNQLGFMERVNAPYPDANMFANLASQYGAADQARQDREAALAAGRQAGQPVPQSSGTVSRGGGGFFTQPADFTSTGTYTPQNFGAMLGGQGQQPRPYIPSMFSQPSSVGAYSGYSSGLGMYQPPQTGFGGGFGSQTYGAGLYGGEDQPYGVPAIADVQPSGAGAGRYGSFLPASSGGAGIGAGVGGLDYGALGLYGGDLNYGTQSSQDYFGF